MLLLAAGAGGRQGKADTSAAAEGLRSLKVSH